MKYIKILAIIPMFLFALFLDFAVILLTFPFLYIEWALEGNWNSQKITFSTPTVLNRIKNLLKE